MSVQFFVNIMHDDQKDLWQQEEEDLHKHELKTVQ